MLVRDAQRNLTVTVTLVVLVALSVTLAAASAGLLARLAGASDRLMEQADSPHLVQMHAGELDTGTIDAWVAGRNDVAAHQTMLLLGIDGADLAFNGQPQTGNIQQNSLVVPAMQRDLLLRVDNQPLGAVDPGEIWLPVIYRIESDLAVGDTVTISATGGFALELQVAGFVRDSIMNTAIASSKRLAVSQEDLEAVAAHTGTPEYLVEFWLADRGLPTGELARDYQDAGLPRSGPLVDSSTFRLFNMISEGMTAGVVILASVLLMVVGLLCLRLSFITAVREDYREIGILRAIGVPPSRISRVYLVKYAAVAALACLLGLLGGWALAPELSRSLTAYMGTTSGPAVWLAPALTALGVATLVTLFVLVLLRRLGRGTAMDALRTGTTGSMPRGPRLRLRNSRGLPTNVRLGLMDLIRRSGAHMLLFLVFAVSAFIVVVPAAAATTIHSEDFITYMGIGTSDVRLDIPQGAESTQLFTRVVEELPERGDVERFVANTTTRLEVPDAEGSAVSLYVENGDHTTLPVTYAEGRAPQDSSEIALSLLTLAQSGRSVGDSLPVAVADGKVGLRIVGSYQDITYGGRTAKVMLDVTGDEVMWHVVVIDLAPGVDSVAAAHEMVQAWPGLRAADVGEYRAQMLGPIAEQVTRASVLSTVAAIGLAVLMTTMFLRMLLAGDASQIAIQRALGNTDGGIRTQYLTRILLVLLAGIPAGVLAAVTLGEGMFNLMFEGLFGGFEYLFRGTSQISFAINGWLTWLALPLAMFTAVAVAVRVGSRGIDRLGTNALPTF